MRRTIAVLFACLAVLAAACSNGSTEGVAGGPPATNPDGSPLVIEPGAPTTAPGNGTDGGGGGGGGTGGGGATRPSTHGTVSSPPTSTGGGSSPTTSRTQSPPPDHPDSGARGPVGAFARTMLRPQPVTRIVVEVMVEPGAEPRQSALDRLVSTLADVSGKQVALSGPVALPAGDRSTSAAEIRQLSDTHSRTANTASQAVVRLLYLRGDFAEEDDVLGVAVRGDTMAIFKEAVTGAGSPFASATVIEEAVVIHEIGHLLGLVDIVVDTGRDDPQHPGHSRNRNSVMYWAVESSLVGQALGGPPSRNFDADDRADLNRIRNGA